MMVSLLQDIQTPKHSLQEFSALTHRILHHLPNVITHTEKVRGYLIHASQAAGTLKYVRPVNERLFIDEPSQFLQQVEHLQAVFTRIQSGERIFSPNEHSLINGVLYTMQQSIGAGLDLLSNPNSARKHVGNRFEELMKSVFDEVGIANKKTVLQIPYETEEGSKLYKCENDIVLSGQPEVQSDSSMIEEGEVVVSVKTTSKDRMGKMFIDKMLLESFTQKHLKVIGIFNHDVQRKQSDNISYTLVSGLFLVYTQFLTKLDGVYYLDLPPKADQAPFNRHLKAVSTLLIEDIWELLGT
ncbi:MAG: hypothetical protein AAF587_23430 [Bacteroidota bacterium]